MLNLKHGERTFRNIVRRLRPIFVAFCHVSWLKRRPRRDRCFLVSPFHLKPLTHIPRWFHGLSDHLTFLLCSMAGFVCMVCYTKPALSRFSNALKINALSLIHSFIHSFIHAVFTRPRQAKPNGVRDGDKTEERLIICLELSQLLDDYITDLEWFHRQLVFTVNSFHFSHQILWCKKLV